jgi:hypothetical protein
MKLAALHISELKVGAIINTSSGGCDSESEVEMLDIVKSAGVTNCRTWCGESDQIGSVCGSRDAQTQNTRSAGPNDLRLNWTAARGMQFFEFERRQVFGVQLDASGEPTGELSKAYTFNLQELKQPIIQVVTASGWTWQPVIWNAPASLRWLTE